MSAGGDDGSVPFSLHALAVTVGKDDAAVLGVRIGQGFVRDDSSVVDTLRRARELVREHENELLSSQWAYCLLLAHQTPLDHRLDGFLASGEGTSRKAASVNL
jgi:hypothetical protein